MGNYFSGTLKWNKQFFRTSSRSNKIQIPRTPLRTRHTWGSVTQHIYNVYLCFVFIDLFVWKTKNIEIFWHLTGKTWHSSGFQMSLFVGFFAPICLIVGYLNSWEFYARTHVCVPETGRKPVWRRDKGLGGWSTDTLSPSLYQLSKKYFCHTKCLTTYSFWNLFE